jgi:two-component system, response regulator
MIPTILLVEDNATDEQLTLMALKKSGVPSEVVVARDGAAALAYLFGKGERAARDLGAMPALILLDLNLPRVSGRDVLRQIRADERTLRVPIVILTSSVEHDDIRQAMTLGANAYVRKHMAFSTFAEAMRTLSVFWLQVNERARS